MSNLKNILRENARNELKKQWMCLYPNDDIEFNTLGNLVQNYSSANKYYQPYDDIKTLYEKLVKIAK